MVVDAVGQAWPPFVLVAGLLLIGQTASADGLFEALGARIARAPLPPLGLLVALLALVAAVTALLNLDTAVVFLTPVLIHAARTRGLDERAFLYGAVFMSNSASLLLPGSNLTNLLVIRSGHMNGGEFATQMLAAWLTACLVTTILIAFVFPLHPTARHPTTAPPLRPGIGAVAIFAAAMFVLLLPDAALPVLAIGIAATVRQHRVPRLDLRALTPLFALAVSLGTLARAWNAPSHLLTHLSTWPTAGLAALSSVLFNNLPAAMLLSAQPPPHPRALLIGLDIGPNLAVTGSLSAILWLQAARTAGARPSLRTYSGLGLILVPLTLAATLSAIAV